MYVSILTLLSDGALKLLSLTVFKSILIRETVGNLARFYFVTDFTAHRSLIIHRLPSTSSV